MRIKFKDAKIERITFELASHKAWKFGPRTERMNAAQRQMFEDTAAEDEADLQAKLDALQAGSAETHSTERAKRQPRREKLPDHLRRIEHHHEPAATTCKCCALMQRVGEDVSERLDVIPAEFIVHRHVRGKWAFRCCQTLVQEPVAPQVVDKGQPTAGLVAHTLVARFVDHLPHYRRAQVNARSGVHTPRSTLASWAGVRAGRHLRRLRGVRRSVQAARAHRGGLPGACTAQVRRTGQGRSQPGGRASAAAHRLAVPRRAGAGQR